MRTVVVAAAAAVVVVGGGGGAGRDGAGGGGSGGSDNGGEWNNDLSTTKIEMNRSMVAKSMSLCCEDVDGDFPGHSGWWRESECRFGLGCVNESWRVGSPKRDENKICGSASSTCQNSTNTEKYTLEKIVCLFCLFCLFFLDCSLIIIYFVVCT